IRIQHYYLDDNHPPMVIFAVTLSTHSFLTLQCHRSFALLARSFAPERSPSSFFSNTSALFACLPGMAPSALLPILKRCFHSSANCSRIRTTRQPRGLSKNQPQPPLHKPSGICTYRPPRRNLFRIRTYEKSGEGLLPSSPFVYPEFRRRATSRSPLPRAR